MLISCIFVFAQELAGSLNGDFSVSQTGAATYKIDIDAPSCNSDFRPQISLVYSSQAGNSIAGYGWNIIGLSSISATPHSRYFDTTNISGINVDTNDAYSIDGERLLLKSGTNGRKNAEYVTEQEKYCKIKIDSAFANTPKSFIVTKPNGSIYRYGSTTNGILRYPNSNSNNAIGWLLDYAEDKDGNYIRYTYTYYNNMPYISQIHYGGNTNGRQTFCSINFTYLDRPDAISLHIKNTKYEKTKRLAFVSCLCNNTLYKRYSLTYDDNSGYSHLVSVKEYGTVNSSLPATTFEWENFPNVNIASTTIPVTSTVGVSPMFSFYTSGDVDNDGKSELIEFRPSATSSSTVHIYHYSNGEFVRQTPYYYASTWIDDSDIFNILKGYTVAHLRNSQNNTIVYPFIWGNNNNGTYYVRFEFVNDRTYSSQLLHTNEMPAYSIADFDKDGIDAIAYVEKKQLSDACLRLVTIKYNTDSSEFSQSDQNLVLSQLTSSQRQSKIENITSVDLDGDGLMDLLVECTNFCIALWNSNGAFSSSNYTVLTNIKHSDTFRIADFNGDGLADILINEPSSTIWKKAINTGVKGTSLFTVSNITNLSSKGIKRLSDDEFYSCCIQDLNSDGYSDIVISYKSGTAQKFCWVVANRNGTFSILDGNASVPTTNNTKSIHLVQGDFDGDGYTNIISLNSTSGVWALYDNNGYSIACNKITSITDGLGKETEIEYKSLLDGYTNSSSATMPLMKFYAAIPVVKESRESWRGTTYSTSYNFSNGVMHLAGKGFLGFKNLSTTSEGIANVRSFSVNDDFYTLDLESVNVTDNHGARINNHNYHYEYQSGQVAKSYIRNLKDDIDTDYTTNRIDRKYYYNYHYGNPGRITSGEHIQQITDIEYVDITANGKWILGLPSTIETAYETHTEDGDLDNFYEKSTFSYDAVGHLVRKQDYKSNTASSRLLSNTTTFQYNTYGDVVRKCDRPYTSNDSLATTFEYNNLGLLSKKTEPDGHSIEYSYNSNGRLSQEKDLWFSTLFEHYYDGVGRETRIIKKSESSVFTPDTTNIAYTAIQNGAWALKTSKSFTTQPTEHEYFDGFGRNSASGITHFDGREFITDKQYAGRAIVGFESVPHLAGTHTDVGTSYEYDSFKRCTLITDPEGKTIQAEYDRGFKRITENGFATEYWYDTDGNLLERVDDAGALWYFYNALGNYDKIRIEYENDPDVITRYTYDAYGRLTSIVDSNGDTRTWAYNSNGYVNRERFGSHTDIYSLNKYGDVLSKRYQPQGSEKTATYTYNAKRQLTSVTGSNFSETYSYDGAGRLTQKYRNVVFDGANHYKTSSYYYNGASQIRLVDNVVDGISTHLQESFTFSNGWLNKLSFNGKTIWQLTAEDAHGNVASYNDWLSSSQCVYNDRGNILSSVSSVRNSSSNSPVLLQHSYQYDEHGRIANKDGKDYEYDDYNQLISWNGKSYSYDPRGNVTMEGAQRSITYNGYRLASVREPDTSVWGNKSLSISYNGNNRPYYIANIVPGYGYESDIKIDYDADKNKISCIKQNYLSQERVENGVMLPPDTEVDFIRFYVDGQYEVQDEVPSSPKRYFYIGGDALTAKAVAEIRNGQIKVWQIYRDELGSITGMSDSLQVKQFYYDPWGRYCDSNGEVTASEYDNGSDNGNIFYRGFLGQEYYSEYGLINLNARLYNPFIGRFLSPDPDYDDTRSILGFNPYIYGNNCPSMYVDPDGEFIWAPVLIGAGVGAIMNVANNWNDIDDIGDFLAYAGIGALGGAVQGIGASLGVGIIPGFACGFVMGGLGGGITAGLNSNMHGGDFMDGFQSAFMSSAITNGITGGIAGGFSAYKNGVNILTGAARRPLPMPDYVSKGIRSDLEGNYIKPETTIKSISGGDFLYTENVSMGRLPDNWNAMRPYAKGQYGVQLTIDDLELGPNQFVKEVPLSVNGVPYRADLLYLDENGILHIVESKAGPFARFTKNQSIIFPLFKSGDNVVITITGNKAMEFYGVPQKIIEKYSVDLYIYK